MFLDNVYSFYTIMIHSVNKDKYYILLRNIIGYVSVDGMTSININ